MEITRININVHDRDRIKAFIDIIFDNSFIIRGIKLIHTDKYFLSMPSRKRKDGSFSDIAFPINEDLRKKMQLAVLDAYEKELNKGPIPLDECRARY